MFGEAYFGSCGKKQKYIQNAAGHIHIISYISIVLAHTHTHIHIYIHLEIFSQPQREYMLTAGMLPEANVFIRAWETVVAAGTAGEFRPLTSRSSVAEACTPG